MADDEGNGVDAPEDDDEEVTGDVEFPMGLFEPADRKTLKNLIGAGQPVEMTISLGAAEVPLRGGLPDPNTLHRFLVTGRFHKVEPIAQYDSEDDTKVIGWKLRVTLRPRYVEAVNAEQAAALTG